MLILLLKSQVLAVGVIMWGYECGVSPAKPQWHTVELGHEIFISSLVVWSSWMSALNCPRVINTLSTARHLSKTLPQGNSLPFTLHSPLFLHSWISTHTLSDKSAKKYITCIPSPHYSLHLTNYIMSRSHHKVPPQPELFVVLIIGLPLSFKTDLVSFLLTI